MPIEVILPRVDMDMATGKIVKWHVASGAAVKKGTPLFDIESDKATMEIEAPADGILRDVRVAEGETSPVGAAVAYIYAEGEAQTAPAPSAKSASPQPAAATPSAAHAAAPTSHSPSPTGGIRATPLARRLARQSGIALDSIRGSGPHGRIVAGDIKTAEIPAPAEAPPIPDTAERIPLDGMRKIIAERLTAAKQTVPHFYLRASCTVDELLQVRERLNARAPKAADGTPEWKLSINDFIVKAFALALQRVPNANVTWGGDCIIRHRSSDVAVAVAVDGGLYTPVVRNAETKLLSVISAEVKDLAARARQRKLQPAEYQGSSASISNLGMYGIEDFTAIINPPHATILAVGAAVETFVPVNGQPVLSTRIACTLSCDHRAVDGALGAELLRQFRSYLEDPALMLA